MTKFQIITLATFILFLVAGVITFSMYKGSSSSSSQLPAITIWGTFPADIFNTYVSGINNSSPTPVSVTYKQLDPTTFSQDFIAALARGSGPDAILIPADMILPHLDKLALISYTTMPARTFMDTYIQEGQIYTNSNGITAIPFTVDPLIMYWNRDMFNTAGIATYPKYWDEFTKINQKITVKDSNGNIRKSAIALGDFTNVYNAREILASLIMQTGNPITDYDAQGNIVTTLKSGADISPKPAFDFFTQFVNPTSENYSWNRGMAYSKTAFLAGNLATYFGLASELSEIRAKNPNLNFDAAPLPQARPAVGASIVKSNYARMFGLSIVRTSANPTGVYQVLSVLTQPSYVEALANSMYLPSVLNSVISQGSTDPYISVFNAAALVAKTWLDADPIKSNQILGGVVESITTGQKSSFQAIEDGGSLYGQILRQFASQ